MKQRKAGLLLAVVLTGCTSFNTLHIGPGIVINPAPIPDVISSVPEVAVRKHSDPIVIVTPPVKEATPVVDLSLLCPGFKFHSIPDTPDPPVKELAGINIHNPAAVNRVLFNHIDVLRDHLAKLKNQMTTDRKNYAALCKKFQEQNK